MLTVVQADTLQYVQTVSADFSTSKWLNLPKGEISSTTPIGNNVAHSRSDIILPE
jgi:hypothetical protein